MTIKQIKEAQQELMSLEKKPIRKILAALKEWGYDYAINTYNYKTKELREFSHKDNCNKALYNIYTQNKHASIVVDLYTPFHCYMAVRVKGSKL